MPSINVTGAAARLLAFGTNTPGQCLNYVWQAIAQGQVHYLTGGAASAYATWQTTDPASRHLGDRIVPKDMPAYLGARAGNALGDVIISRGDGTFAATDYPNGHVGICTLQQRIVQTGRPYLGWASTMGGYTLTSTSTAGGGVPIPDPIPTPKEDMMPSIEAVKFTNEPGGSVIALVGEFTYEVVSDFTASRYLAPGTTYRAVDQPFLTYHQQLVGKNLAKIAALLPPASGGAVDLTPVLNAIAAIPSAPTKFVASA
jgi:hypothetical protein